MKKLLTVLALAAIAGIAQAQTYYWYVYWAIDGALSPTADPNDLVAILDDYSVTWSLMSTSLADPIAEISHAKYTPAEIESEATWGFGDFNNYLTSQGDATFAVETDERVEHQLYQRIVASNGTDSYYWESETKAFTPTTDLTVPAENMPGTSAVVGMDVAWTKASDPSAVPEPATLSLLGLGALAMVVRRKVRK